MPKLSLAAARQLAETQLTAGDPSFALAVVQSIQRHFPRDFRAAALAGRAYLARGEREQAEAQLRTAMLVDPEDRPLHHWLGETGSDADRQIMLDLPPLEPQGDERAPISPAALGHLFLRQQLFAHASSQLGPLWEGQPERLDIGSALTEALWQLGETVEAEEVCRAIRRAAPDCLKVNLILGQILFVSGRQDEAGQLLQLAKAVDPENERAEELYARLAARDANLVPLSRKIFEVEVPEVEVAAPQGTAEPIQEAIAEAIPEGIRHPSPLPEGEGIAAEPEGIRHPSPPPAGEGISAAPSPAEAGEGRVRAVLTPPYAAAMADSEGILATLGLTADGGVAHSSVSAERAATWAGQVRRWTESVEMAAERLDLGSIRYAMVESKEGEVHLLPRARQTEVVVAAMNANSGLVRVRLRRRHGETEEQRQEQDAN